MNTNRPIPEAIDGLPWTVTIRPPTNHGGGILYGVTDLHGHAMTLPPEEHTSARFVRLHELAHAKWTPRHIPPHAAAKKAKATVTDVQTAEDLRIQSLLHVHGLLPRDLRHRTTEDLEHFAAAVAQHVITGNGHAALEVLTWARVASGVAVHRRKGTVRPRHRLSHLPELAEELDQIDAHARALIDQTGNVAHALALENATNLAHQIAAEAVEAALPKRYSARLPFAKVTIPLARKLRELLDAAKDTFTQPNPCPPPDETRGNGEWGTLETLPPLPLGTTHQPKAQPQRKRLAQLQGTRLGSLRRLLTDGRAFRRDVRKPQKGGTILIDASGSMDLTGDDIRAILDRAPAATVAMYSGSNAGFGSVSVIAKAGRMATDREIDRRRSQVGGGNIIDGPALRWLAKQAEPRTWICDGIVTGKGDSRRLNLTLEANSLAKAGRITRHASVNHYLDTLRPCSTK
jgi:hypothetical protein